MKMRKTLKKLMTLLCVKHSQHAACQATGGTTGPPAVMPICTFISATFLSVIFGSHNAKNIGTLSILVHTPLSWQQPCRCPRIRTRPSRRRP